MQKKTNPMLSETHPVVNKHSWLFKIGMGYLGLGFRCQIAGVYREPAGRIRRAKTPTYQMLNTET